MVLTAQASVAATKVPRQLPPPPQCRRFQGWSQLDTVQTLGVVSSQGFSSLLLDKFCGPRNFNFLLGKMKLCGSLGDVIYMERIKFCERRSIIHRLYDGVGSAEAHSVSHQNKGLKQAPFQKTGCYPIHGSTSFLWYFHVFITSLVLRELVSICVICICEFPETTPPYSPHKSFIVL